MTGYFPPTPDGHKNSHANVPKRKPLGSSLPTNIHGRTYFFYAEDMSGPANELMVKRLLSNAQTDSDFHPPNSIWVSCKNIFYRPHSNECGSRSLLALAVMLTHPNPCHMMLMPYMHPNVAQEAECWVASSILQGRVELITYLSTNVQDVNMSPVSQPHSFIDWNNDATPTTKDQEVHSPKHGRDAFSKQYREIQNQGLQISRQDDSSIMDTSSLSKGSPVQSSSCPGDKPNDNILSPNCIITETKDPVDISIIVGSKGPYNKPNVKPSSPTSKHDPLAQPEHASPYNTK
jgi:hypothetical protein